MRHDLTRLICWGVVFGTTMTSVAVCAQDRPPALPPSLLPDVRLRQLPQPGVPGQAPEIPVPETAPTRVPAGAETVRLTFGGFDLEGVTAYPGPVLEKLYRSAIGTEVSLAQVYGFAKDIQQLYREDGYFLSRVIIPEQSVRGGRFRLRVLEGFVSSVSFEGDIGSSQDLVTSYFQAIPDERPLRLATLERALLLANDVPGIVATALLRPSGRDVGGADLVVTVSRTAFEGFLVSDNYGDKFTGEWEASAGISANAFTPLGEQVTVIGFTTEPWSEHNQNVGQVNGSWRVGSSGLFFEVLGSYGNSNPGDSIEDFNFDSKELLISAAVGYPIIRTRDLSLSVRLGFDYIDDRTDVFGGEQFSRDKLRVLDLGARSEFRDTLGGANVGEVSIRQGLPILDATKAKDEETSRVGATGSSTVLLASAQRLQPLVDAFALYGQAAGQYAFSNLLSEEQFDVGGTLFGRGYDFSELSGDDGVGATVELRYTYRLEMPVLESLQPFAFYDFGRVWQHATGNSEALSSTGFGLRAALFKFLSVEVAMAKPLGAKSERADDTRDPQFLFRAVGRL
jgi:hemolysin activation/secretion protein